MRRRRRVPGDAMIDLTAVLSLVVHLIPMLLVTVRFREVAQLDASAGVIPAVESADAATLAEQEQKVVSVRVTDLGFVVGGAGEGDPLLPCTGACTPESYPYPALTVAMVAARQLHPSDRRIVIASGPDVPYEVVVGVMDAVRSRRVGDRVEELFTQPLLAVQP